MRRAGLDGWMGGWMRGGVLLGAVLLLAGVPGARASFEPVTCKNNGFTEDQEIAEGQKVAAKVYQQMPVLAENDPVTKYVQGLGAKLVPFAPMVPGVTRQWPFNFHVVASSEINAFALPGGSIFVNLGTVQAAETEGQLAGVMAHEISHVVMRHSTCNLAKQQRKGLLYGIGAIGSAILLGNGAAGSLAQAGIGMGQNLDFLHMSRGDEQQADLLGVDILYDAGYDPRGLPQFFETIKAKYGEGGSQFLSDHPNPGNRTEYVNAEIATLPRREHPVVTTEEFKRVHALAMGVPVLSAKEVQAGAWRRSGVYATGPGSNGGTVVPAAVGTGGGGGGAAETTMPALGDGALGRGGSLEAMQAARFRIEYPAGWQTTTDARGTVMLAPAGGATAAGLGYGAEVGIEAQNGNGVADRAALAAATTALVGRLTRENAGLAEAGTAVSMEVGGRPASAVNLRGTSPVVGANGARQAEHDWLVTVSRPDGDLSYMVFVAPEGQFGVLKPVFDAMVGSFRAQ